MSERRLPAIVVGPGNPGFLRVRFGRSQVTFVGEVSAEKIPPDLRVPNSAFVAVVLGRDLVGIDLFGEMLLEFENQIRVLLNAEWDPIGVAAAVDDEYDGYIAGISGLLKQKVTVEKIAQHLGSLEVECMGLGGSPHHKLLAVAESLRKLPFSESLP